MRPLDALERHVCDQAEALAGSYGKERIGGSILSIVPVLSFLHARSISFALHRLGMGYGMKRMILLVLGVLMSMPAAAQDAGFGAGAVVGSPGGVTAKQWIAETQAIAGVVNFGLADEFSYLQLQADLLFHMYRSVAVDDVRLATYVGGGVSILLQDEVDSVLYLRAPFGVDAQLTGLRLGVFVEVAPLLRLTDSVSLSLAPAIGARYFFGR